jgi:phosphoribosylformylglycinamidine synthase I
VNGRIAVVTFPGSNDDGDALRAVEMMGGEPVSLWHADPDLSGADAVILPGGFSYGDYLRTGAIARFAPVMAAVREFAASGGPVLGVCNGFQILCEAGLLPGALIRNRGLAFICRWVNVRSEATGEILQMPIKHGEGQFVASPEEVARLEDAFNPNGSTNAIAGLRNERGNVMGLMPHPEHAVDPDLGPTGGQHVIEWLLSSARAEVSA